MTGLINVQTDPAGRFQLTGLAPGKHVVVAKRIGFEPARRTVRVQAGKAATLELVLSPKALELADSPSSEPGRIWRSAGPGWLRYRGQLPW